MAALPLTPVANNLNDSPRTLEQFLAQQRAVKRVYFPGLA